MPDSICEPSNGMLKEVPEVYLLYHQFEIRNNKEEDLEERAKLIGIYSNEEEAKRAIQRVKDQPGFRDYPQGFLIDCYELNQNLVPQGVSFPTRQSHPIVSW